MTASGDGPALVVRRHATATHRRVAGAVWICLLSCFWLAGAVALAQEKSPTPGKPAENVQAKPPETAPAKPPEKFANSDCLDCHLDPNTNRVVNGKTESLVFPKDAFAKSVHAGLACTDCHPGIKELVHDKLPPANCTGCHDDADKQYAASIHGVSHLLGASGAAQCWDCHGSHDILPVKDPASPVFKLNLPYTCAKCHSNMGLTKEYAINHPEAAAQYMESIHGRALLKMGLIVAPSCSDCHGAHDIKRAVDRDSPINHANVAKTCGKCHFGVEETYDKSIHGQLLAKGDPRGPVCTDCHTRA